MSQIGVFSFRSSQFFFYILFKLYSNNSSKILNKTKLFINLYTSHGLVTSKFHQVLTKLLKLLKMIMLEKKISKAEMFFDSKLTRIIE